MRHSIPYRKLVALMLAMSLSLSSVSIVLAMDEYKERKYLIRRRKKIIYQMKRLNEHNYRTTLLEKHLKETEEDLKKLSRKRRQQKKKGGHWILNKVAGSRKAREKLKAGEVSQEEKVKKTKNSSNDAKKKTSTRIRRSVHRRIRPVRVKHSKVRDKTRKHVSKGHIETGIASYYADKFHGRTTASGELFDNTQMMAAHKTLPFGTRVKVKNLANNKVITVVITDRGPYRENRIIDLTQAAFAKLDSLSRGILNVEIEVLQD